MALSFFLIARKRERRGLSADLCGAMDHAHRVLFFCAAMDGSLGSKERRSEEACGVLRIGWKRSRHFPKSCILVWTSVWDFGCD